MSGFVDWATAVPGTAGKAAWEMAKARRAYRAGSMSALDYAAIRQNLMNAAGVERTDALPCDDCGGAGVVQAGEEWIVCEPCDGLGRRLIAARSWCDACNGSGYVVQRGADGAAIGASFACPSCHGTGRYVGGGALPAVHATYLERMGVPAAYTTFSFEGWFDRVGDAVPLDTLASVVRMQARTERWQEWAKDDGPWSIVLSGQFGTGKTGLTVAACRAALSWCRPRWILWPALLDRIHNAYRPDTSETRADVLRWAIEKAFVVIDDFGRGARTDHAQSVAEEVIDGRYVKRAPTIVTTTLSLAALTEQMGGAVASRLSEGEWIDLGENDLRVGARARRA